MTQINYSLHSFAWMARLDFHTKSILICLNLCFINTLEKRVEVKFRTHLWVLINFDYSETIFLIECVWDSLDFPTITSVKNVTVWLIWMFNVFLFNSLKNPYHLKSIEKRREGFGENSPHHQKTIFVDHRS